MCFNYPGIKLEPVPGTWENKIEHLPSYAHVVHTTAKQVISRRRKNENVYNLSKDEKCTCKACKNTVFHCRICKFVGFLLPSSSWLLKLPKAKTKATAIGTPEYSDNRAARSSANLMYCANNNAKTQIWGFAVNATHNSKFWKQFTGLLR